MCRSLGGICLVLTQRKKHRQFNSHGRSCAGLGLGEVVLRRVLLQSLVDAEDEHFACETYLGKSYREPYLDDFFHVNLPGQHSFLVSKDIMTAHGAMHSGDVVRLPNSLAGILRLCVTGKCRPSN